MNSKNNNSFQNFLNNPFNYADGTTNLNGIAHSSYIKLAARDLGITLEEFYSASVVQIFIWSIQIQDSPSFNKRSKGKKIYTTNISLSGKEQIMIYNTLIAYMYFCCEATENKKPIELMTIGNKRFVVNSRFTKREKTPEALSDERIQYTDKTNDTLRKPLNTPSSKVKYIFTNLNKDSISFVDYNYPTPLVLPCLNDLIKFSVQNKP